MYVTSTCRPTYVRAIRKVCYGNFGYSTPYRVLVQNVVCESKLWQSPRVGVCHATGRDFLLTRRNNELDDDVPDVVIVVGKKGWEAGCLHSS